MWFKIINNKKFLLISIFVFLYLTLNLFDGERGLISYFEKKQILNNLEEEENNLSKELDIVEKKNKLLSVNLDKDFLETLIRQKLKFGKATEKVYLIQQEND
jgi:cell division protein FtsB